MDIPAQPLSSALFAYSKITGAQVLVDDMIGRSRRSTPLHGVYDSADALQILVAGTGLEPRAIGDTGFTLVPIRPPAAPEIPVDAAFSWSSDPVRAAFYTGLQGTITRALDQRPEARPGNYRAVVQLRFTPDGTVRTANLLESTGNRYTDAAIVDALRGLSVGHAPPDRLAQPVTFVILPRAAGQ
jgi:TonB family protein